VGGAECPLVDARANESQILSEVEDMLKRFGLVFVLYGILVGVPAASAQSADTAFALGVYLNVNLAKESTKQIYYRSERTVTVSLQK
jgi:hypothetical protein